MSASWPSAGSSTCPRRSGPYVSELADGGYGDATVRNLLDMRSGVRFVEHYTDPDSDINQMDRRLVDVGLRAYLPTLVQERPHGGAFLYRSSETDVLGWVCEKASGVPMQTLMSEIIWQPMGAERDGYLSCDVTGMAIHDGGLAASPRDLARFGMMLVDGGGVPDPASGPDAVRTVVPSRWLRDSWGVDSDIRSAFAESPTELAYPGGWYRNQFWFRPSPNGHRDAVPGDPRATDLRRPADQNRMCQSVALADAGGDRADPGHAADV